MSVISNPIRGVEGRFQLNGVNVNLDEWEGVIEADDLKEVGFEQLGFEEGETGFQVMTISFNGTYDRAQPPLDPGGPNFRPGNVGGNCKLYLSQPAPIGTNKFFSLPSIRILSVTIKQTSTTKGTISGKFKSDGSFIYPVG